MRNPSRTKAGCVVTGVAGFVGSHLAERLLSSGFSVVGVDNFFSGRRENMAGFLEHPDFTFYERSITEPWLLQELKGLHPELSRCFHLAAVVSVPYSVEHPEITWEINYNASVSLLKESELLDFEAFVFAGSAAEYGADQRLPLLEEYACDTTRRLSPYGEAKFLASRAVGAGKKGAALRFFNIYGPRQDPRSPYSGVISRFMDMALKGEPLTIFGNGRQTRDFVYVSDVVDAYLHAAGIHGGSPREMPRILEPSGAGRVYNVGTGRAVSVLELATLVQSLVGNHRPFLFMPERPGDIRHSLASIEAFQKATGWRWKPSVTLEQGLKSTLAYSGTESA